MRNPLPVFLLHNFRHAAKQALAHVPQWAGWQVTLPTAMIVSGWGAPPLLAQMVPTPHSAASGLTAQAIPPPQDLIPPSTLPSPQPTLPTPAPTDLLPAPTPTPPAETPVVPGTIVVNRFEVVGSTVFSPAELANVTAPFTGRPLSFAELLQVRSAITQLYVDRGYITSGALIPPQTLEAGVVQIQVVEGRLAAIQVTGAQRLQPAYVRSRLALAAGPPLNRQKLLEALQLLQLNPLISRISAELVAGAQPGTNILEVRVTEAPSFHTEVGLDNGRSPGVGSVRRRVQVGEANLLGLGDSLQVGYTNTDGSNSVEGSYTLPLNPRNGTLSFNFNVASSRIVESPFDVLDIEADSRSFDLSLRQPMLQSPGREFALGMTVSRQESETTLLGLPYPLSPGADLQGQTRLTALRFFQEWTQRDARSVFALRSQFSIGLGSDTINPAPPDSRFLSWRLQAQWVRLLAPDTLLLLRSDLQLADRALLPVEQFSLGGLSSVRGYRQDLLLTDNGIFGSLELRVPVLRVPQWQGLLQVVPFFDVGSGWNSSGNPNPAPHTLATLGLGLRWQMGDRLTATLDWGIPLIDVDSEERSLQEKGVYFSVLYRLW